MALNQDDVNAALEAAQAGWILELTRQIEEAALSGITLFAQEHALIDGTIDFTLVEPLAVAYAQTQAAQAIAHVSETTRELVRQVIADAIENGWSINETAKKLSDLYSDFEIERSITIARTEIAAAMNWGKHEAAIQAAERLDMDLEKRWSAVRDGRTRESHAAVNTQWIKFDETFSVGGFPALRPHDPGLPASETINCRCVLLTREAPTENTEQ